MEQLFIQILKLSIAAAGLILAAAILRVILKKPQRALSA